MVYKICSMCDDAKPLSEYHKMRQSKDGHRPNCKTCVKEVKKLYEARNPIEHRLVTMASTILKRIKYAQDDTKYKHLRCYKENNVQCLLGDTRDQITQVLRDYFYDDIKSLIEKGLTPSVDRIDSSGNYEIGNIRIIDSLENGKLGFISANKKRMHPVRAVFNDGSHADFESLHEASRHLGIPRSCIARLIERNGVSRKDKIRFKYIS